MKKTEVITLRIDCELLDQLRTQALTNYRTIAKEIAYLLTQSLNNKGN
jgi:hypothetical protein